ncbi:MAG: STAS domain-containing protein [Planctomycetota bacterium]
MKQLEIDVEKPPFDAALINLKGILNTVTVVELESLVQKEFLRLDKYYFIFNLSGITSISSAGAGFFIKLLSTVGEHKGVILFTQLSEQSKEMFNLLGLSAVLNITPDTKTAKNIMERILQGEIIKGLKS